MNWNKKIAIFDMDGTVLDSMNQWRSLNVLYAESLGVPLTDENRSEIYQLSGSQLAHYLKEHFSIETNVKQLVDSAYSYMHDYYITGLPEKPGAKEYLRRLGEAGVKRVLATATPTDLAEIALDKSGLASYFDVVTTTRMIGLEKYTAEFWLEVARRAGGEASDCVVYEDALYAMQGAKLAQMEVVGIEDASNLCERETMRDIALAVVGHFDELK